MFLRLGRGTSAAKESRDEKTSPADSKSDGKEDTDDYMKHIIWGRDEEEGNQVFPEFLSK